jgi:hypothetical protein
MMWGYEPWMSGWMSVVMMIGSVLFWAALIGILVLLVRQPGPSGKRPAESAGGSAAEATLASATPGARWTTGSTGSG